MSHSVAKKNGVHPECNAAPKKLTYTPQVDILELPDELVIHLDLPGVPLEAQRAPARQVFAAELGNLVGRRLQRLIDAGQISREDGRYLITGRTIYLMAGAVNLAHRIIFGRARPNLFEKTDGQ